MSERFEILTNCKTSGPSIAFTEKYPELADLIKRMVSNTPALRPNIKEIKNSSLFKNLVKLPSDWQILGLNDKRNLIKIGANGKCKAKYVKLQENNLLVYNRKDDEKAKFCYPLEECKIITEKKTSLLETPHRGAALKRMKSTLDFAEKLFPLDYSYKVCVEHPQLETLYLYVQSSPLCSAS